MCDIDRFIISKWTTEFSKKNACEGAWLASPKQAFFCASGTYDYGKSHCQLFSINHSMFHRISKYHIYVKLDA